MRLHLLFIFFLTISTASLAQKNVLTADTTFYLGKLDATVVNTYDSACRLASKISTFYDYSTQQPTSASRDLYSYYQNDSLRERISQIPSADTFTNFSRAVFSYTSFGKMLSEQSDLWDSGKWVPNTLLTHTYNTAGQQTTELSQNWDTSLNAYVNGSEFDQVYDSNGNSTAYISKYWDKGINAWTVQSQYVRVFDANNYVTSDTTWYYDNNQRLLYMANYEDYYNNSKGVPDSALKTYIKPGRYYDKIYYTYFPGSIIAQQAIIHSYTSSDVLTLGYRYTYFYDSTANTKLNSQDFEMLTDIPSMTYTFSDGSFTRETYNEDHSLQSIEYGKKTYDSILAPIYATVSQINYNYSPCQSVLPVTLLSFTANKKDNNAVLQWKTANETNTSLFNVQRSTDGVHFTTISSVQAAGNSSGERSYTYTDFNISNLGVNKLYYRLAQQDINGSLHNSRTAQVEMADGKLSITLSPNPVRNSIGMYSPVAVQNAVIRIANVSGTVVYTSRNNLSAGGRLSINASSFAPGIYYVTVQTNNGMQVVKLVKE